MKSLTYLTLFSLMACSSMAAAQDYSTGLDPDGALHDSIQAEGGAEFTPADDDGNSRFEGREHGNELIDEGHAADWRFVNHDGRWWYRTTNDRWMVRRTDRWVNFEDQTDEVHDKNASTDERHHVGYRGMEPTEAMSPSTTVDRVVSHQAWECICVEGRLQRALVTYYHAVPMEQHVIAKDLNRKTTSQEGLSPPPVPTPTNSDSDTSDPSRPAPPPRDRFESAENDTEPVTSRPTATSSTQIEGDDNGVEVNQEARGVSETVENPDEQIDSVNDQIDAPLEAESSDSLEISDRNEI